MPKASAASKRSRSARSRPGSAEGTEGRRFLSPSSSPCQRGSGASGSQRVGQHPLLARRATRSTACRLTHRSSCRCASDRCMKTILRTSRDTTWRKACRTYGHMLRLLGVVLVGDLSHAGLYRQMIRGRMPGSSRPCHPVARSASYRRAANCSAGCAPWRGDKSRAVRYIRRRPRFARRLRAIASVKTRMATTTPAMAGSTHCCQLV